MNSKILNSMAAILILVVGSLYLRSSIDLGVGTSTKIGPGFYPYLLGIILIILTIISLIQTWRKKEEEKIEFPNGKLILTTIGVIALFILSWSFMGYFYIHLFFFIFILYSTYSERLKKQFLFKNAFHSLMITVSIFIIFDVVLNLPIS
ncbi:tripartite tricarboxylate transporter TctB family protein [Ammoniphilus sp. 3BR4]|uniref:tripartite tricarboxylate transporter TctB family protein n=1 Tax=Ammoniphilus sp. 3BR4 TaxID=3158265 RepID=UPI003465BBE4